MWMSTFDRAIAFFSCYHMSSVLRPERSDNCRLVAKL